MNGNSAVDARVEASGTQVAPRVGLHLLGRFADRLEVGDTLSGAVPHRGERAPLHDRGKVLVHAGLMLAGGGETCTDVESFATGGDRAVFTDVCSDSTLWRVLNDELVPGVVDATWVAVAKVRSKVWARSAATTGSGPVVFGGDLADRTATTTDLEGPPTASSIRQPQPRRRGPAWWSA